MTQIMSGATTRFLVLFTASPTLLHRRCPSLLRLSRHRVSPPLCSLSQRHHYQCLPSSLPCSFTYSLKPKPSHQGLHTQTAAAAATNFASSSSSPPAVFHPWPEWSNLIQNLYSAGYFNRQGFNIEIDGLAAGACLPEDFLRAAAACLAFAGDRPGMLGMLSRRDIEVIVANGTPFLFENVDDSARRLRFLLVGGDSSVLSSDRLHTVDLMKFILSYASDMVSSENRNLWSRELVEPCVRNLLSELVQLSHNVPRPSMAGLVQNLFPDRYGGAQRPQAQNVEMKKGDWICPRCNFMNFARNVKCRECEEARPRRQLTGGEWECPQCDYFNYGRNKVCLRCDCKRPVETLVTANSSSGLAYGNLDYQNSAELDSRLAANEEKAQRWFSKMSQLDGTSDMNSVIADEDFPEIMPLRKGVNRFVVSTRKTPLERRLANAQFRKNVVDDHTPEGNDIQRLNEDKTTNQTTSRRLGEILGHDPFASCVGEQKSAVLGNNELQQVEKPISKVLSEDKEKGQPKNTERWFKKVAELHNVTDLTSSTSDDSFPEVTYKRHMTTEPEKLPENINVARTGVPDAASLQEIGNQQQSARNWSYRIARENTNERKMDLSYGMAPSGISTQNIVEPQHGSGATWSSGYTSTQNIVVGTNPTGNLVQNFTNPQASGNNGSSGQSWEQKANETENLAGTTTRLSENQNISNSWTGKSLEGSAVKEPDPLDMSEEAKAERWFRRVAQIKDISELSQIPDEDFPSIMPMRKGVNRFVVSKRKTPLERRLTSTQYRRNLPAVNSDPAKENDSS